MPFERVHSWEESSCGKLELEILMELEIFEMKLVELPLET